MQGRAGNGRRALGTDGGMLTSWVVVSADNVNVVFMIIECSLNRMAGFPNLQKYDFHTICPQKHKCVSEGCSRLGCF